jgi:hypothetical protein
VVWHKSIFNAIINLKELMVILIQISFQAGLP